MPSACKVREHSVYQFFGEKFHARPTCDELNTHPKRPWSWSAKILSPLVGSQREYVVMHDEDPLAFHTTLFVLKKGQTTTIAQLELQARSKIDLWTDQNRDQTRFFLALTGFQQEGASEVQWVIPLHGTEQDAQGCQRKLRGLLRRLSRLDREFRLGGSAKLYIDPDRPHQPVYKSKAEWLLGSSAPFAEPLAAADLHCYGIVPRRAELISPLIDACFRELLAGLEAYTLRPSSASQSSASKTEATEVSPLLTRVRCATSMNEHTIPPSTHRRSSVSTVPTTITM
ncbi:hypothetical protein MPSI1_001971 [Malassezia psittaci]|uniref:Uncharacterized protein n=1 Tax=Malassezia psittaci TaxID=1821823 RepID=A0AAF0F9F1_9BASI|nr:hypothetical protein MPSI1_001971 [Malassezia psittaci]